MTAKVVPNPLVFCLGLLCPGPATSQTTGTLSETLGKIRSLPTSCGQYKQVNDMYLFLIEPQAHGNLTEKDSDDLIRIISDYIKKFSESQLLLSTLSSFDEYGEIRNIERLFFHYEYELSEIRDEQSIQEEKLEAFENDVEILFKYFVEEDILQQLGENKFTESKEDLSNELKENGEFLDDNVYNEVF